MAHPEHFSNDGAATAGQTPDYATPTPRRRSALKQSRPSTPAQLSPLSSPFSSRPLVLPDDDAPAPTILNNDGVSYTASTAASTMPSTADAPTVNHHTPASVPLNHSQDPAAHPPQLSHPQTPAYTPKVSFDTFENPAASMFSFTLRVMSEGYKRTRNTRVFLCAASPDESGSQALDWCLESLVQDGDELIVFRGVDEDGLEKDHDILRDDARDLMRTVQDKSVECDPDRKVSLILEYIPGKITDSLDRLIALYRPDSVVVGTRGRRPWQGMGGMIGMGSVGSVSKYCLSHSPVPVIVVRPERKVKKVLEKRRADPKRGKHFE